MDETEVIYVEDNNEEGVVILDTEIADLNGDLIGGEGE